MRRVLQPPGSNFHPPLNSLTGSPGRQENLPEDLEILWRRIRACRQCQDRGWVDRARPVFSPVYPSRWMLIGQAPGIVEGECGLPFSGRAGRQLFRWLAEAGWPERVFRDQVYMTAMTRCYPGKNSKGSGDRPPGREELAFCRPFLEEELAHVQPSLLILVGKMAIQAFFGPVRLEEVVGRLLTIGGSEALPLPHPSGASRWLNEPVHRQRLEQALRLLKGPCDAGDR